MSLRDTWDFIRPFTVEQAILTPKPSHLPYCIDLPTLGVLQHRIYEQEVVPTLQLSFLAVIPVSSQ